MAHQFFTMTTPSGNKYAVFAPDMLIPELAKNEIGIVNWENFNPNDKYFDDNGFPYDVSICDQIVEIYEHDIMEAPDYDTETLARCLCSLAMDYPDPIIVKDVEDCIYNLLVCAQNPYNASMFRTMYRILGKIADCNIGELLRRNPS